MISCNQRLLECMEVSKPTVKKYWAGMMKITRKDTEYDKRVGHDLSWMISLWAY